MRFSVTSSPRVRFSVTSSPRVRFSVTSSPRVRFSVECAFPHLGKRDATSRKSAVSNRRLTEKRILQPPPHGKAHSARQQSPRVRLSVRVRPRVRFSVECAFPHLRKRGATSRKSAVCGCGTTEKRILQPAPHGKAHSATQQSPRVHLFVRARPRVRFSVECAFSHLGKRGVTSRKSAVCGCGTTEKRILCRRPHGKAHSPTGASRKSAFCADGLTEKRSLRPRRHQKAQSATAPRPQRDGKAHSAHDASRKAHSAIPRRAKLRLFVRQPSQSAPLTPRDTQCRRIRRGHLRSL